MNKIVTLRKIVSRGKTKVDNIFHKVTTALLPFRKHFFTDFTVKNIIATLWLKRKKNTITKQHEPDQKRMYFGRVRRSCSTWMDKLNVFSCAQGKGIDISKQSHFI